MQDDLDKAKWVYERYNVVATSERFPNLIADLAELAKRSQGEVYEQASEIDKAKKQVAKQAEDRRLAALAAQAKKKNTKKGNKKQAEEEEPEQKVQVEVKSEVDEGPPNLHDNKQFLAALKKTWPRPFTFGPIRFPDLNIEDGDVNLAGEMRREQVAEHLMAMPMVTENPMLIHGVNVLVKKRKLKRRSSLLKHSRFLQNMTVTPNVPAPVAAVDEGEANASGDDDA